MFPADESKWDKAQTDKWTWDAYVESAQKLHKAGFPVGLPMGQTSDAVDWVGGLFNAYGAVFIDAKDNIKINSDQTRQAMEVARKIMETMVFFTINGTEFCSRVEPSSAGDELQGLKKGIVELADMASPRIALAIRE